MFQIKSPSYSGLALDTFNPDDDETCLLYNEEEGEVVEECVCPVWSWENSNGCGNGSTGGKGTEDRGNGCDEFNGTTGRKEDKYRVGRGTRHCEEDFWSQDEKGMEGINKRSEGRTEGRSIVKTEDRSLVSSEDKSLVSTENRSIVKNEYTSQKDKSIVSTEDRRIVRIYDRNLASTEEMSLVSKKDRSPVQKDHDYQEQTDDNSLERTEGRILVITEDKMPFRTGDRSLVRTEDRSQVGEQNRSLEMTESVSFFLSQLFVEEGWKQCVQQTDSGEIKLSLTEQISARL